MSVSSLSVRVPLYIRPVLGPELKTKHSRSPLGQEGREELGGGANNTVRMVSPQRSLLTVWIEVVILSL